MENPSFHDVSNTVAIAALPRPIYPGPATPYSIAINRQVLAVIEARKRGMFRRLNSLAIAATILGSISLLVGITTCSLAWDENRSVRCENLCAAEARQEMTLPRNVSFAEVDSKLCRDVIVVNVGEGIWCSLVTIVAGLLGISAASGKEYNDRQRTFLLRCHQNVSAVAAGLTFLLMTMALTVSVSAPPERGPFIVMTVLTMCLSFFSTSVLMCSVGFSYCIAGNRRSTACGCCDDYRDVIQSVSIATLQHSQSNWHFGVNQPHAMGAALSGVSGTSHIPVMTAALRPQMPGGETSCQQQHHSMHSAQPPVANPVVESEQPPRYSEVDPAAA